MQTSSAGQKHVNPIYGSYFADPFVWFHEGTYYAIGTGELEAAGHAVGKVFPLLQSHDFYLWQFASNALIRPDPDLGDTFWAPSVAFHDGLFHLFYSVGKADKDHHLRVATSESPQGPYKDTGTPLTSLDRDPFAIDPHPFRDANGRWYLFFARDFLDHADGARPGTALVARELETMTRLSRDETTILRARHDWQRFQSRRSIYGREWDWHTLEGPCVVLHQGTYYCFYSGGRWENESYGVDYAFANRVVGPYRECSLPGPRILHTLRDRVIGPGHNSVIQGPDGEDYIVYHAWNRTRTGRFMFIDRLSWTSEGPVCEGPTWGSAFEDRQAA